MVLGETVSCLAAGRPDMEMGGGGGIRIAKRGNTKLAAGIFVVKGFPFVAKEFREDANANQKLCIALNNSEQIASPPAKTGGGVREGLR
jgi:hypothetical protein